MLQNREQPEHKYMTRHNTRATKRVHIANNQIPAIDTSSSSESQSAAAARARNTATTHQERTNLDSAVVDQPPNRNAAEASQLHIRNRHGQLVRIAEGSMCTGRSTDERTTKVMKHVGSDSDGNLTVEVWGEKGNGKYFPVWIDRQNKTRIGAKGKNHEKKWLWEVDPDFIREYGFNLEDRKLPEHITLSEASGTESESTDSEQKYNSNAADTIDNVDTEVESSEADEAAINIVASMLEFVL